MASSPIKGIDKAWQSVWSDRLVRDADAASYLVCDTPVDRDDVTSGARGNVSNVLLHPRSPNCQGTADVSLELALRITNHDLISAAYGPDAARQVHAEILARVQAAIGDHGVAAPARAGVVEALLWEAAEVCGAHASSAIRSWLLRMAQALMLEPVQTFSGPIHAEICASFADPSQEQRWTDLFGGFLAGKNTESQTFRREMAQVTPIMCALRDQNEATAQGASSGLELLWCPIVQTANEANASFFQASLGLLGKNGAIEAVDNALMAADRLGFGHFIDHYVLAKAIAELSSHPSRLTLLVSVAVSSLRREEAWDDILSVLAARPAIAQRLVIELRTGGAQEDWRLAGNVISKFKKHGTRIALGDFATGDLSIKQLILQKPDFITIDSRLLRAAGLLGAGDATFAQLVDLARTLGAQPIVSGIDDETSSILANSLNAKFKKGPWLGTARVCRPWVTGCSQGHLVR